MTKNEWLNTWFAPLLPIFCIDRDYAEAKNYKDNLIAYFKISSDHEVLDGSCGNEGMPFILNGAWCGRTRPFSPYKNY